MQERRPRGWMAWVLDREQARRVPFLARSPLFVGLPRRLLGRLGTRFLEKAYDPGDVVFLEGDPGRALFVVVEGTVEISRATPKGERVINTLGAGDAFGELALIDDSPRSGTARVTAPTRFLILYKTDFDALIEAEARIAVVVQRNLLERLLSYLRSNQAAMNEAALQPEAADPS